MKQQCEVLPPRGKAHVVRWAMLLCGLLFPCFAQAWTDSGFAALDKLGDAERYRQLNLILMVSEGADASFADALLPQGTGEDQAVRGPLPLLKVDDFQTPLNRIVDQRAMISSAVRVFRFALDNRPAIMDAISGLAADDPAQVAQVDLIQLAEDAIIIRSALAGSIEYLAREAEPALASYLKPYQKRTVYLRNVMEYWKFDRELAAITDDAIADTGGRMAAYQRMLEDEPNLVGFKQHLQAIEEIYRNSKPVEVSKKDLQSKELIDQESQVTQPD